MPHGLIARARSVWRAVRRRAEFEADMQAEFRFHQESRAADLVRAGLPPAAAARQARLEFGDAETHKDDAREARGLRRFDQLRVSWLDVRLGFRMLRRYPGLAVVGGLAFALAVAAGAAGFEMMTQLAYPTLPLPDGERIVALRAWDAAAGRGERRLAHEFAGWRGALRTVEELGAYRTVGRNLVVPGGEVAAVPVAEISASAFRVAAVPPLVGRALVPADERPDASPVLVIGHDVWRTRFGADPGVVGRTVRLDGAPHTVVGVMPEGFAFPLSHAWWAPLRLSASGYAPGDGPTLELFGRLAPGATLGAARAELAALGRRAAAEHPDARAHVRPEVVPFAESIYTKPLGLAIRAELAAANIPAVLFLLLVCGNVAMLTFARAATREGELVVRTVLGASRGRVVTQLFAEALVLGGVAAVLGLAAVGAGLRPFLLAAAGPSDRMAFWIDGRLSPPTVLYAAALTVFGAAVAGVVPALKVTRGLTARLRAASAGGGGPRFGGVWTAVIVCQVAVTVGFPVFAWSAWRESTYYRSAAATVPAGEYLTARLAMDRADVSAASGDTAAAGARFRAARAELARRLAAEPAVWRLTHASALPLTSHPWRRVEVAGAAPPATEPAALPRVGEARVADNFFAVFGAPVLAGRGFHAGDLAADARVVVVNRSFVRDVLGGRNPVGRRVRYSAGQEVPGDGPPGGRPPVPRPGPWYEIVGVVPDLGVKADGDPRRAAGMYHPAAPDADELTHLAVHVRGDAAAFAQRLRALAAAADPALRLDAVLPMDEAQVADLRTLGYVVRLLVAAGVFALLLSLAGLYAVTSFTVARRTREIGVRVALGADAGWLTAALVRRPLTQVAAGVVLGCGVLAILGHAGSEFLAGLSTRDALPVAAYAAVLVATCGLACLVPARRALAVQPTEALRGDG